MLRLDGSVKDNTGEATMRPMKSEGAVKFNVTVTESVHLFSYCFYDIVCKVMVLPSRVCLELYSMCELPESWMLCLEHKSLCEFYTSTM